MMAVKKKFLGVYQEFFKNKGLLGELGTYLTVSPEMIEAEEGWKNYSEAAHQELLKMLPSLVGGLSFQEDEIRKIIDQIASGYKDQDYWRDLLFDYVDFWLLKEEKEILAQEQALLEDTKEAYKELLFIEAKERKVIDSFASKIQKEGFRVDAKLLISNYIKMTKRNKEEAWQVLITNPAMFAPILVKDEKGKTILSPEQARSENVRLARFLKTLKL